MTHEQDPCGCEWEVAATGRVSVRADCPAHGGQLVDLTCPCGCQAKQVPQWWKDYSMLRNIKEAKE